MIGIWVEAIDDNVKLLSHAIATIPLLFNQPSIMQQIMRFHTLLFHFNLFLKRPFGGCCFRQPTYPCCLIFSSVKIRIINFSSALSKVSLDSCYYVRSIFWLPQFQITGPTLSPIYIYKPFLSQYVYIFSLD